MTEKWEPLVSDEDLEDIIKIYCNDFTALERAGRYDPITGRDKEIDDALLILLQKGRKNVCFLAPAGVGKTAAVVGIAQRIVRGDVPDYLKNSRVLEVDLARMAAGTSSPAEFQSRFIPLCKGVAERYHNPDNPRIILFIDEVHQIMPSCEGSSYKGLSDVMKPYLTVGDLMVIGATTLDEFRMYVSSDPALDRRFQKIFLNPPNVIETYRILQALRPGFEKHHKVKISNEQLMLIVKLTNEHMRKRNQPDKSIITMDAAMAHHVKEFATNKELALESIYYMVGRETGLNKSALHDERKIEETNKEVKKLEEQVSGENISDDKDAQKRYDASLNIKDVEIDENYQDQLKQEKIVKEQQIRKKDTNANLDKQQTPEE
ncbi:MAG: ATP-dependent Clp protease ATP-binding subunit [Alphaproteobacteria bacterium]|nr:ATP-dependent Clp protease ATP-binding subunit [Alphaproteobacteria bacterium]